MKTKTFEEVNYKFIKLSERYFFGFIEEEIHERKVNIASKEKAILDCLLHLEYCGGIGEVAIAIRDFWKDLNWQDMKKFLKKMDNSAVERRLQYILLFLKIRKPISILGKKEFIGFRMLDPSMPKQGEYDKKFGLRINIFLEEEML